MNLQYIAYRYALRVAFCALLFLTYGCAKDDLRIDTDPMIEEGQPATLLIGLKSTDMQVHTRSVHDLDKESEINSLAVFIFDPVTGIPVSSTFHAVAGVHAVDEFGVPIPDPGKIIKPNGSTYIPIETLTGNNRHIYVVANYEANVIEELKSVASEADLKNLVFRQVGNPIFREFGLMKVGSTIQNIRPTSKVPVTLNYVSAKISLKVTNNDAAFEVTGWTIGSVPSKGYVMERGINPDDPNYHDACDITSDYDYYNDFADQQFAFETVSGDKKNYSSAFYIIENRRGGRISRAAPSDGLTRQPYQLKAWYAPKRASYIKIYGNLTEDGSRKQVVINHYLGEDNKEDYNIYRGKHYTYTVTINGHGNIHIDTNVETSNNQLRVTPPADPTSLDAHFGFRTILVHTQEILSSEYSVDVEVVNAINSTDHPGWADLATVPVTMQHVKTSTPGEASLWQQDGGANGSFVRPKFIPKKAVRAALGASYSPPSGVTIGSAEFPEDDESLSYDQSTHRMCKKITNLPTKAMVGAALSQPLRILLYTDEYEFNPLPEAQPYREAVIRVTLKKNGVDVEYTHFIIRQNPPLLYMHTPIGDANALLVERVEEYEHMLQAGLAVDRQMLAGLQWGPWNLTSATDHNDGKANTLYGVYTNPSSTRNAGNYVQMYGSEGGSWSAANNGRIENYTGMTIGNPFFNLPILTANNYVNTIYNTTAARYCHEKNWDKNGDGNIDDSETLWYLPSTLEMQQYWTLHELLNLHPDYYWSSTRADANNAYAFSMMSSLADADRVYNGTRQSLKKTGWTSVNRPRVRCVRRAAAGVKGVAPMVRKLANNNLVVDCSNLPGSAYTMVSKMNIPQGDVGAIQKANRSIYKKLEIQPTQPAVVNYYQLHTGNGLCDQSKGWRLPTQREMLLIWAVFNKLEATGGADFAKFIKADTGDPGSKYWTLSRGTRGRYLVDFNTGLSVYEEFTDSASPRTRYYRCVRELP